MSESDDFFEYDADSKLEDDDCGGDYYRELAEDLADDALFERRAADKRLAAEQAVLAAAREYARAWASFRTQRGPETAEATYAATNRLLHAAEALPFEAAS